ncbi:PatB family C-S lyase [Glaciecola sp. XM2]|jgi:cystathionine beta-lyase|uniref:MalY/PatB family protein n=1 Tax=Glaciecola sp. XM2 TaxID=1914931 RepID=UPI001BDEEF46|nr:PatB family C-S lyase [Glaciecola sp. XM2]MBT1450192.1 PatB family C-S lyase [Glaciecola sp. XM2]
MNFDTRHDRSPSFAYKWEKYKGKDIIPCWIADTEFRCAQPIIDVLKERSEHGLFGYTLPKHHEPAISAIVQWCKKRYDWAVHPSWIVWTPGVVPAFNMASRAFCGEGEGIIVQTPNYPPLLAAPAINKREQLCVPTVLENGRWTLDLNVLEEHAAKPSSKLFIMCNPMNPSGSVMTKDELDKVADICNRHGVTICSDEIHCDLILDDLTHIPASKHEALSQNSITLMAASKTFNIAGLGTSFAIIPDVKTRQQFVSAGAGIVPWVTVMGLSATEAAFTRCDDWYLAQRKYLRDNRDYLLREINQINGLRAYSPQATFLMWVDASGLGVEDTQQWCEQRGVGPSPGRDFGAPDFFRVNFGCAKSYLEEIVTRLSVP